MSDCAFSRRLYSSFTGKSVRARDTVYCMPEPDQYNYRTSLSLPRAIFNVALCDLSHTCKENGDGRRWGVPRPAALASSCRRTRPRLPSSPCLMAGPRVKPGGDRPTVPRLCLPRDAARSSAGRLSEAGLGLYLRSLGVARKPCPPLLSK